MINYFIKIVYYKHIKVKFDILYLVKIIINIIERHYSILKLFIIN